MKSQIASFEVWVWVEILLWLERVETLSTEYASTQLQDILQLSETICIAR